MLVPRHSQGKTPVCSGSRSFSFPLSLHLPKGQTTVLLILRHRVFNCCQRDQVLPSRRW